MTHSRLKRIHALLPAGFPRYVRIYDNGGLDVAGGSADRYTVVFTGNYTRQTGGGHWVLGMSGAPFWPQGICLHASYREVIDARRGWPVAVGRACHLGRRIGFQDLPTDCQRAVLQDYCYLWDLPLPAMVQAKAHV
jgi:hypothetical protein